MLSKHPGALTALGVGSALSEPTPFPVPDPGPTRLAEGGPGTEAGEGIKTAKVLTWCVYTPKCLAVIRSSPFMRYK